MPLASCRYVPVLHSVRSCRFFFGLDSPGHLHLSRFGLGTGWGAGKDRTPGLNGVNGDGRGGADGLGLRLGLVRGAGAGGANVSGWSDGAFTGLPRGWRAG